MKIVLSVCVAFTTILLYAENKDAFIGWGRTGVEIEISDDGVMYDKKTGEIISYSKLAEEINVRSSEAGQFLTAITAFTEAYKAHARIDKLIGIKPDEKTTTTNESNGAYVDGKISLYGSSKNKGSSTQFMLPYQKGNDKLEWKDFKDFFESGQFEKSAGGGTIKLKGLGSSSNTRIVTASGSDNVTIGNKEFDDTCIEINNSTGKIQIDNWRTQDTSQNFWTLDDEGISSVMTRYSRGDGSAVQYHEKKGINTASINTDDEGKLQIKNFKTASQSGNNLAKMLKDGTGSTAPLILMKGANDAGLIYTSIGKFESIPQIDDTVLSTNDEGVVGLTLKGAHDNQGSSTEPMIPNQQGSGLQWNTPLSFFSDNTFKTGDNGKITLKGIEGENDRIMVVHGQDTIQTKEFDGKSIDGGANKVEIKGWSAPGVVVNTLATMMVDQGSYSQQVVMRPSDGGSPTYVDIGKIVLPSIPSPDEKSIGWVTSGSQSNYCIKGVTTTGNKYKPLLAKGNKESDNIWATWDDGTFDKDAREGNNHKITLTGFTEGDPETDVTISESLTNSTMNAEFASTYTLMARKSGAGSSGAEIAYIELGDIISIPSPGGSGGGKGAITFHGTDGTIGTTTNHVYFGAMEDSDVRVNVSTNANGVLIKFGVYWK